MNIKKKIMQNKNIWLLVVTMLFSITIYFIDAYFNGKVFEFISNNIVSKVATIFFTTGGVLSLFFSFTFKKDISETDISNISKKTIEKDIEERKLNKRIEEQSTF